RDWQQELSYCFSGAKWERDVNPVQEALLCYILDQDCSPAELIVKEGSVCLTREDFWSLGLSQCMESNIGNACLKIVEEMGKDIHIFNLYVVPLWKADVDPFCSLPDLTTKDLVVFPAWSQQQDAADHYLLCHFPLQSNGHDCGIFMLMYALCISTSTPFTFSQWEMPTIRRWWCLQIMERFCIEGHGQRFAHWTEESSHLLEGILEPVFRVPKSTSAETSPRNGYGGEGNAKN
ncbi:uncharacterized protein LOC119791362, partial [Cyprinodon tularosa]|uniref:uncharacterized protein LOC119791362 n=1 Tax=Cyprinodon tularosa TaxID=77115 RepID=UPI0018E25AEB